MRLRPRNAPDSLGVCIVMEVHVDFFARQLIVLCLFLYVSGSYVIGMPHYFLSTNLLRCCVDESTAITHFIKYLVWHDIMKKNNRNKKKIEIEEKISVVFLLLRIFVFRRVYKTEIFK